MNKNVKFFTALKFLLKKLISFPLLVKIFANYPKIAKYLKYFNYFTFFITTLSFLLSYFLNINLGLLEKLGVTIFISHLLGKSLAYFKTLVDFIKDRIESSTLELPSSAPSKPNTSDWNLEYFKQRKVFYEKLEEIKSQLAEGKTVAKTELKTILNSGVELSEQDKTILSDELKNKKGWFSYPKDHPYITALVLITGAAIVIYFTSGGSSDDGKTVFVGWFTGITSYFTSKNAEINANNSEEGSTGNQSVEDNTPDDDERSRLLQKQVILLKDNAALSKRIIHSSVRIKVLKDEVKAYGVGVDAGDMLAHIQELEAILSLDLVERQQINKELSDSSKTLTDIINSDKKKNLMDHFFPKRIDPSTLSSVNPDTPEWEKVAEERDSQKGSRSVSPIPSTSTIPQASTSGEFSTQQIDDTTNLNPFPLPVPNKEQYTIAHYFSSSKNQQELRDILNENHELGYLTDYMILEIEKTKEFDNMTLEQTLKWFKQPEYNYIRELHFPHLAPLPSSPVEGQDVPLPEVQLDEIVNWYVVTPKLDSDPFSDLQITPPSPIEVSNPASPIETSNLSNPIESDESSNESTDEEIQSQEDLTNKLDRTSIDKLRLYTNDQLVEIYKMFTDKGYPVPSKLFNVMEEKGVELGLGLGLFSFFKKTEKQEKSMLIQVPSRLIAMKSSEISKGDYEDLELLRVMSWMEIKDKVPFEELIYSEQLFELLDEPTPHEMQIVINYYKNKLNPFLRGM